MEFSAVFMHVFLEDLAHLAPILMFLGTTICALGLTIGRIEGWSWSTSLYHAFINATTVGYGDLRPSRPSSRILAVINAFVGLLLAGVFVGTGVHSVEMAVKAFP